MDSPAPSEVINARETVQERLMLGVTKAQDYCAGQVHVNRRTWQSWEYGDRKMPPGLWELFNIKT